MEGEGVIEELKSSVTKCVMCKVGKVSTVSRSTDKSKLVIYGRNGMRLARHLEARCMVHGCRAGYYHGYMTYKGHTVYDDFALKVTYHFIPGEKGFPPRQRFSSPVARQHSM